MEILRFNFCHPILGKASLTQVSPIFCAGNPFMIDSDDGTLIEISVEACMEGKWTAMLEWEYDSQRFTYQKDFEIRNAKLFQS